VVFHDLALPDPPANLDHLVIGPSGVFVIDSKRWAGSVHQSADGLIWHNHYRLDRTLATLRWQAETLGRLLGVPAAPLICIHGAHVQGGGLRAQGVAIVPFFLLRSALGYDQVLSEVDVERYVATARMRLRPAASARPRSCLSRSARVPSCVPSVRGRLIVRAAIARTQGGRWTR
jgi:hypothetical protein